MPPLQAITLSKTQASAFKKAYAEGDVATQPLFNLLPSMPAPVFGLETLPVRVLDPVHFHFTGNRPYCMQVVSDGTVFALLSHQRLSKSESAKPYYNTVRMEVIDRADLPFLKVAQPPTLPELRRLRASFMDWLVAGHSQVKPQLQALMGDELLSFSSLHEMDASPQEKQNRIRIISGESAHVVLADWLSGSSPARPRIR